MKKNIIIAFLLLIGLSTQIGAQQAALQFLKISPDARGSALAGSLVSSSEDISALHWNPSGLASLSGTEIMATFNSYLLGSTYVYGAMAKNVKLGTLAFGATMLSFGESTTYTSLLDAGTVQKNGALAFSVGYGIALSTSIDVGGSVKYATESISGSSINGIMGDIGIKAHLFDSRLQLGFLCQNLGYASEKAPLNYKIGGSLPLSFGNFGMNPMFELDIHPEVRVSANVASEFSYDEKLFLRLGYKIDTDPVASGDNSGISMGIGAVVSKYVVDVSWVPMNMLGNTVVFSLIMNFGKENANTDEKADILDTIDLGL